MKYNYKRHSQDTNLISYTSWSQDVNYSSKVQRVVVIKYYIIGMSHELFSLYDLLLFRFTFCTSNTYHLKLLMHCMSIIEPFGSEVIRRRTESCIDFTQPWWLGLIVMEVLLRPIWDHKDVDVKLLGQTKEEASWTCSKCERYIWYIDSRYSNHISRNSYFLNQANTLVWLSMWF